MSKRNLYAKLLFRPLEKHLKRRIRKAVAMLRNASSLLEVQTKHVLARIAETRRVKGK